VLACVASIGVVTSVAAVLSVYSKSDTIAVFSCVSVISILVVTGLFGRSEAMLVARRLRNLGRSLLNPIAGRQPDTEQWSFRLQGSQHWELMWQTLLESAEKLDLAEVRFDVSLPSIREDYHARWKRKEQFERDQAWVMEFPLNVRERAVGRVCVVGRPNGHTTSQSMEHMITVLEPFESSLEALTGVESATTPESQLVEAAG
jgi:hypothetical protein